MKRYSKHFIILLAISFLLMGCSPKSESAPETTKADLQMGQTVEESNVEIEGNVYTYIKYCLESGGQIRVISAKTEGDVLIIPSRIKGYPVRVVGGDYTDYTGEPYDVYRKEILPWQQSKEHKLKQIIVQEGVMTIHSNGFEGVLAKEIVLPESLDVIEYSAFAECNVERIKIKSKNVMLCESAFEKAKVKEVHLPEQYSGIIRRRCFKKSTIEKFKWPKYEVSAEKKMGQGVFFGCEKLREVKFPENQDNIYIPDGTFTNCTSLKKLVFPASTKKVTYKNNLYANNHKKGVETLVFEGTDTKVVGCKYKIKGEYNLITAKKIIAPKNSKAAVFAKTAKRIGKLKEWVIRDIEGGHLEDYTDILDYVTLNSLQYEERVK